MGLLEVLVVLEVLLSFEVGELICSRLGLVNEQLDWRRERLRGGVAAAAGGAAGGGAASESWSSPSGGSSLSMASLSWVRSWREG